MGQAQPLKAHRADQLDLPPLAASPDKGAARRKVGFRLMEAARFRCRTLEEAAALATFLAAAFPDPKRAAKGIAELLCNAIEHGSLEIGYELKGVLLKQKAWRAEVDRRLEIEPYASRSVEVVLSRKNGGCCVVITDQGPGFDWKRFLSVNPARAGEKHGRGVAQARTMSFDALSYNDKGNRVVAFMKGRPMLKW